MYQQLDVSFSVNINSVNSQSSQSCNISPQKKTCSRTAKRTRHIFGTEKSTNLSQISNGLVCKARKKPSGPKFNGKSPSQVERRNQRERQRVKKMNQVYKDLALILADWQQVKDQKLTKSQTLKAAIEYIEHLEDLIKKTPSYADEKSLRCFKPSDEMSCIKNEPLTPIYLPNYGCPMKEVFKSTTNFAALDPGNLYCQKICQSSADSITSSEFQFTNQNRYCNGNSASYFDQTIPQFSSYKASTPPYARTPTFPNINFSEKCQLNVGRSMQLTPTIPSNNYYRHEYI